MSEWPPKPDYNTTKDGLADARAWANGSTWDAAPSKPLLWKCEYRIMPTKMAYPDPHQQSLTKKVKP